MSKDIGSHMLCKCYSHEKQICNFVLKFGNKHKTQLSCLAHRYMKAGYGLFDYLFIYSTQAVKITVNYTFCLKIPCQLMHQN